MDINLDRKEKKAECRVNKTERVRRKEVHACTLWSCNNMYSKCWLCTTCFFGVFFFQKAHAPCEVCFGEQTIHEWRQMTVTFFSFRMARMWPQIKALSGQMLQMLFALWYLRMSVCVWENDEVVVVDYNAYFHFASQRAVVCDRTVHCRVCMHVLTPSVSLCVCVFTGNLLSVKPIRLSSQKAAGSDCGTRLVLPF